MSERVTVPEKMRGLLWVRGFLGRDLFRFFEFEFEFDVLGVGVGGGGGSGAWGRANNFDFCLVLENSFDFDLDFEVVLEAGGGEISPTSWRVLEPSFDTMLANGTRL